MRYSECSNFFKIYEDKAEMLVCLKRDKILGRAIIWNLPEGTFMDRIYTCYDYLESQFIEYAENHKWYHRVSNKLLEDGEIQEWLGPEDKYKNTQCISLIIQLDKEYKYMPYMDSFRYYNPDTNTISTDPKKGKAALSHTDGTYCLGDKYVCGNCGNSEIGYDEEAPEG